MATSREQNERKFGHWEESPGGGRVYARKVPGRMGWHARYVKAVDARGKIVSFRQEIYNEDGQLVEVHEKYPKDSGHQKVTK